MHVILLVLTIFFADSSTPPKTVVVEAPSVAACQKAGPELKAEGLKNGHVRDVEFTCVDHERHDNA